MSCLKNIIILHLEWPTMSSDTISVTTENSKKLYFCEVFYDSIVGIEQSL
jgi:hypothetical protein